MDKTVMPYSVLFHLPSLAYCVAAGIVQVRYFTGTCFTDTLFYRYVILQVRCFTGTLFYRYVVLQVRCFKWVWWYWQTRVGYRDIERYLKWQYQLAIEIQNSKT